MGDMFNMSNGSLISGLVVGSIGTAMFIYGKKQQKFAPLGGGLALCALPMFITSALLLWGITAVCIGGVWFLGRGD